MINVHQGLKINPVLQFRKFVDKLLLASTQSDLPDRIKAWPPAHTSFVTILPKI